MNARATVFFAALTVLIGAIAQHVEFFNVPRPSPWPVILLAAVFAAALMAHARVGSRLPRNLAWYGALAVLAGAFAAGMWTPYGFAYVDYGWLVPVVLGARLLLMVTLVLVLLRLEPRTGGLYEGTPVPGVLLFFAATALLYESIPIVDNLRSVGLGPASIERLRGQIAEGVVAATTVAIFIVASGIRHRLLQPNPSRAWLWGGLAIWLVAAALYHLRDYSQVRHYAMYAKYVFPVAQAALFIGVFYLLSHLMPRRAGPD